MADDKLKGRISGNTVLASIALGLSILANFLMLFVWNSNPQDVDVDVLSFSITVLETVLGVLTVLLAVGAFAGFWMIRSAAMIAAREEARRSIEKMAPSLLQEARRVVGASNSNEPETKVSDAETMDILERATPVGEDDQ